jgi:uncharacterized protein YjbI with pentapeptide repeats
VDQEQRDGHQQQRWWATIRRIPAYVWIIVSSILVLALILIGYHYKITLWDWAQLLFVPAVLAAGGYWFNRQQQERQRKDTRQQHERALKIAERRSENEALQSYLDQMSDMLIPNKDRPSLYSARPGDSLSSVARARTLTVLPRLDQDLKARVVQFLYESSLLAHGRPMVTLRGALLTGANLKNAYLRGANLEGANLEGANLEGADLQGANLTGEDLLSATLREADLRRADLTGAYLHSATLAKADLRGANLSGADLREASLNFAYLHSANLNRADLGGASLGGTILFDAFLGGANMAGVFLMGAGLEGANLGGAHLSGAQGWDDKQFSAAAFLKGATMPDGQKYEDWLKSKGRGENGKNSDPS